MSGGDAGRDAFGLLGLDHHASPDDVRQARRRLAKLHHPDAGGDAASMRAVNHAAALALRLIAAREANGGDDSGDRRTVAPDETSSADRRADERAGEQVSGRVVSDVPSFTVEALPAETFEALLVVASWLGETLDDDPPYRLDVLLDAPLRCWCRLDVVPDAGASTVSLTLAAVSGAPLPVLDVVRDAWVDALNHLDWPP